eukprot:XP_001708803.1 Hypothetical protein GL50803_23524 [Giardia lamblia ATCC 50803]
MTVYRMPDSLHLPPTDMLHQCPSVLLAPVNGDTSL